MSGSSLQTRSWWSWSQVPCPSQPAVVQALSSVSVHGVLSGTRTWVCTQVPVSPVASQPADVQALLSVSAHGVLAATGTQSPVAELHWPVLHWSVVHVFATWLWSQVPCPLQPAVVQALLSVSGQGVLLGTRTWVCTHVPVSPVASQPADVQALLSVSAHGVLAATGTQRPAPELPWPVLRWSVG